MEQTASLIIQVSSRQVEKASSELEKLGYKARRVEKDVGGVTASTNLLSGSMARLLGVVGGVGTALAGFNKLKDTAREFEVLRAQITTATGSLERGVEAFGAVQDFAATTPYSLKQSTEAFISLVNLGLDPSTRALRSYGNTAAALNRDIGDMVNAVSKATVGEFEPLKSFGISAQKESDGIAFTFRGLTTKVGNSTKEIEDYFIKLGETNFGNSMQLRMKTLDGALSNLADSWDQMFDTIATNGAGELIEKGVRLATQAIEELTAMIASGQLGKYLEAFGRKFEGVWEAASLAFGFISSLIKSSAKEWGDEGATVTDFLIGAFVNIGPNVVMVVKGIGATLGLLVQYARAAGEGIYETITGYFRFLITSAENVALKIKSVLTKPFGGADFELAEGQKKAMEDFANTIQTSWYNATTTIKTSTEAWKDSISYISEERDKTIKSAGESITEAERLRAEWEKTKAARKAANEKDDPLAKNRKGGDGTNQRFNEAEKERFQNLVDSLVDEETAVQRSYERRAQMIRAHTKGNAELEATLISQLNAKKEIELMAAREDKLKRLDDEYTSETLVLRGLLDRREITEKEFQARSKANWEKYQNSVSQVTNVGARQVQAKQLEMMSMTLTFAGDIMNQMSGLVNQNSKAAKAMFITSKAIAMAQAIINTELGATAALGMGPMGIPMSAWIRGTGYASVAMIAATAIAEYGGKFEHGGMIPAGKLGITQEAGFEVVRGPAVVSSARTTADRFNQTTASKTVVNVHNYAGVEVQTKEREEDNSKVIDVIIKKVENALTTGVQSGGTKFARSLEQTYKLGRAN